MSIAKAGQPAGSRGGVILAGDVGGTKTLLGIFESGSRRPRPAHVRAFATLDYADFNELLAAFFADADLPRATPLAAAFGVAGPVLGSSARLTNVPWVIDAARIARHLGVSRVHLLNDLEAMAYAVPALDATEIHVLQEGEPRVDGNVALIAAGTGLGEAMLHDVAGTLVAVASESGHADWAARSERDIDVLRDLTRRFGRAEIEHVVSGPGLLNLHRITHAASPCRAISNENEDAAAAISAAGMTGQCAGCVEALDLFVAAYGAEAGNLALRTLATRGLFLGGGIAPKILPALESGRFLEAFRSKAPFDDLLRSIPVNVILNPDAGLLGAAVHAQSTL